jgi:cytoskeletal protein CcmA (bactofilin family)
MEDKPKQDPDEVNALETPEPTGTDTPSTAAGSTASSVDGDKKDKPAKKKGNPVMAIISRLNIYLLLFILIVVLAAGIVFIGMQRAKKEAATPTINTTPLTKEDLAKIQGTSASVGDPKQTLAIESNAIFSGQVLVRGGLEVAGQLKLGNALNLPGITVAGTSTFDQFTANSLNVSGDSVMQGSLNVQRTLTVGGGASFGGPVSVPQITIGSLQLNGDLTFSRHIDAGGATPGVSSGTAVGSGGTVSISGTDTAGTVNINTGGSPPAGCFATISFNQRFNATPHVVVTPVGSAGGGVNFYVNRSTTNFSICTVTGAPAGSNFAFDYIVIE